GNVLTDVVAARVETGRLPERVHDAVRAGAVARSGDPLPVARVVGDVAVDEPVAEVTQAVPPVDAEVAGQERRGDEARAVVHEALAVQLAHARVHDRDAGGA